MMRISWTLLFLLAGFFSVSGKTFSNSIGQDGTDPRIKGLNWEGLEGLWLHDEKFPTYHLSLYFADGAMSDGKNQEGETEMMFGLLRAGTNRYNQKQISDALEFYGVSMGANVSHEYSVLGLSGLVKDIVPTLKMVCHLFNDSVFPRGELEKEVQRMKSSLLNITSSPSSLADRAFRQLSLKGTAYEAPTDGTLQSIGKIKSSHLKEKLSYFNKKVKKRVYLSGPPEIHVVKDIILKECGWNVETSTFVRKHEEKERPSQEKPKVFLIPVPKANQAQIRIGRFLAVNEIKEPDLMSVISGFLGGGFTSLLMQELRVKRGLTYGVSAVAGPQRDYGRTVVTTFTKNETLTETIEVIRETLDRTGKNQFSPEDLKKSVDYLAGRYLFGFEKGPNYVGTLLYFDHLQRPYKELYDFPQKIRTFTREDVSRLAGQLFLWDLQSIVVVGDKSLLEPLKKLGGEVKVIPYKNFL